MGKNGNHNVCPVCKKSITSEFKLYPHSPADRTVCEKCGRHCHYSCVKRVRNSYLGFNALEYSVCERCYPEIEGEDRLNRSIGDGEGFEEHLEGRSRKLKDGTD
jgi:hypothetical protein